MRVQKRVFISLLVLLVFAEGILSQSNDAALRDFAEAWAKSTIDEMSEDEKLGQLYMLRAYSHTGKESNEAEIKKQIKENKIGGLCFFQGDPKVQAKLTNAYQKLSDLPLLISMDAEWGLGMRFKKDAISFPYNLELGAIQNNQVIYELGKKVADHCKRIGVHINFAPVVDVNNNPSNPVINDRSYGEDKYNVTAKGSAFMKGMQDNGVIACAKHFPGHGDTDTDSHYDLPVIQHDVTRLRDTEFMPFQSLINDGVKSIMIAHLSIPSLDSRENRPTTLSRNVVTDLLKKEMGFNGLVITDAMDMAGVAKHFKDGIAEAEALLAGNDILLLTEDIPAANKAIKKYIADGKISWADIEKGITKILVTKYMLGLVQPQAISDLDDIDEDINDASAIALKEKLIENALTMVRNRDQLIPIRTRDTFSMVSLSIGANEETDFQKRLKSYGDIKDFQVGRNLGQSAQAALIKQISKHDVVFVSLHDLSKYESKKFGITESMKALVSILQKKTKVVLTIFGSPYALFNFEQTDNILMAYSEDPINQDKAAQALFGVFDIRGRLPVSSGSQFTSGMGEHIAGTGRLGYCIPERVGICTDSLSEIDDLVAKMIRTKAAPGCQILCAKDGKIIYHKAFGHHTYKKKKEVALSDIYDVASVTKVLASTLGVMKLREEKKISLYAPIVSYIPEIDTSNKKNLILEDVLAHHAGLRGWVPFYEDTVEKKSKWSWKPNDAYYRDIQSDSFSIKVMNKLFMRTDYVDSIWSRIYATSLKEERDYKYSDLGFYLTHKIVENVSTLPFDQYIDKTFYKPLGLRRTMFKPFGKVELEEIAPTEEDHYFRDAKVHGHVHDMGAAMLGGVSGHAGLFSNAGELAVLMQTLLNGGSYGGEKLLQPSTIKDFTTRHYRSKRRGIGFDMKQMDPDEKPNMAEEASSDTFGHLGFTGTAVFADPKENLIYIFLSNRTYPSMENRKFGKENYRPKIQSVFYKALNKS